MKRDRIDPLSAALGVIVVLIAVAVILRRSAALINSGPWWIAIGAIALGIGLIPWQRVEQHPNEQHAPSDPTAAFPPDPTTGEAHVLRDPTVDVTGADTGTMP